MGGITSLSALIKMVTMLFPVPQEDWLFHSKSVGGLWATPASAAQTWRQKSAVIPNGLNPAKKTGMKTGQGWEGCKGGGGGVSVL